MVRSITDYPLCPDDHLPMVHIHGKMRCAAQYIYTCLGGQAVIDLQARGKVSYYIFEDGHELPVLCPCCGEPMYFTNLEKSRQKIVGRRLKSMAVTPFETNAGVVRDEFCLIFSKRGLFSRPHYSPIAPEAAAEMKHPAGCAQAPKSKKRLKRR